MISDHYEEFITNNLENMHLKPICKVDIAFKKISKFIWNT